MPHFEATITSPDMWKRVSKLRLSALRESPRWFGGDFESESEFSESQWRSIIEEDTWCIFSVEGKDVGIMAVAKAEPHRNTDCWLHSCWVDPEFRGKGIMPEMIKKLDDICRTKGWVRQGLGVWPENERAIASYERNGFKKDGELQRSRRRPNQMFQQMVRLAKN